MKSNQEIVKTVEEAVKTFQNALAEAEASENDARWRKDVATEKLNAAVEANDAEEYRAVKDELAQIENDIELTGLRIEKLKTAGPMPKSDLDSFVQSFMKQINMLDANAAAQICEHLDAVNAIADEAQKTAGTIAKQTYKICSICGVTLPNKIRSYRNTGRLTTVKEFVSRDVCIERYRQNWVGKSDIAALAEKAVK